MNTFKWFSLWIHFYSAILTLELFAQTHSQHTSILCVCVCGSVYMLIAMTMTTSTNKFCRKTQSAYLVEMSSTFTKSHFSFIEFYVNHMLFYLPHSYVQADEDNVYPPTDTRTKPNLGFSPPPPPRLTLYNLLSLSHSFRFAWLQILMAISWTSFNTKRWTLPCFWLFKKKRRIGVTLLSEVQHMYY